MFICGVLLPVELIVCLCALWLCTVAASLGGRLSYDVSHELVVAVCVCVDMWLS